VGIDIGKTLPHSSVLDAEGTPCGPHVLAFANTRAGYTRLLAMLTEATAHAAPVDVTGGCEAPGPYWLSLDEALIAQGYRGLGLTPCM